MRIMKADARPLELPGNGDRIERMMREIGRLVPWAHTETALMPWGPAADLEERDEEFVLTAELPGVAREDVELGVDGNILTLRARKEDRREEKDRRYVHYERSYGEFERSFTLPRSVAADAIRADLKDGVLTVHLPKAADAKSRRIEVGTG